MISQKVQRILFANIILSEQVLDKLDDVRAHLWYIQHRFDQTITYDNVPLPPGVIWKTTCLRSDKEITIHPGVC